MVMTPYVDPILILSSYKKLKARKLTIFVICSVKRLANYITKFKHMFRKIIFQ